MMPCIVGESVIEADDSANLHLQAAHAHERFVKVVSKDGSIHLYPFAHLHSGERAVFENSELYRDTAEALAAFKHGGGNSTDWLFDDDE